MAANVALALGERIVVVGASCSGKPTLGEQLSEALGLPFVELDALFWEPIWTEPDDEVFRARIREATSGDQWVVAGNYLRHTMQPVWPWTQTVHLLLEVEARAEAATGTRDDDDAHLGVDVRLLERRREGIEHRAADRVEAVRAVKREDVVGKFDEEFFGWRLVGHGCPPGGVSPSVAYRVPSREY
jgi:hypothetical protein